MQRGWRVYLVAMISPNDLQTRPLDGQLSGKLLYLVTED